MKKKVFFVALHSTNIESFFCGLGTPPYNGYERNGSQGLKRTTSQYGSC